MEAVLCDLLRLLLEVAGLVLLAGIGVQPCCCGYEPSDCNHCSGSQPTDLQVVIAGMVDGTCSDCTALNATYVLVNQGIQPDGCPCWHLDLDATTCTAHAIRACMQSPVAIGPQLLVTFLGDWPSLYLASFASAPDCSAWSDLEVPVQTGGWDGVCDDTSSTCTVTAL